jgi:hypothetical protein
MARYEITLKDRTVEVIDGADAYQQEGQMTTFFALSGERLVVDCWSTRLASFRTSEILIVRRRVTADATTPGASEDQGTYAPSQAIEESATSAPPMSAIAARSTCGGRITTARASTNGKALMP